VGPEASGVSDAWRQLVGYLGESSNWWGRSGLVQLTWNHVQLSVAALLAGCLLAVPPALVLGHVKRGGLLAVSLVNIGRALPSFGIVALVLPFSLRFGFGLGFWPTFVALVLLAVPPIFTNTYTGVRGVPPDVVQAAEGMGMRPLEVIRRVEVPAALPLIVTGIRVSAVQVVATATLGALVGFRCLGTPIIVGFQSRGDRGALYAGALFVAVLSIATEAGFGRLGRRLTPWSTTARHGRLRDTTISTIPSAPPALD
jgi:osmoprotectant transport system permease protein